MPENKDPLDRYKFIIQEMSNLTFTSFEEYDVGKILANDLAIVDTVGIKVGSSLKSLVPLFIDRYDYDFSKIEQGSLALFNSHSYASRDDYRRVSDRFLQIFPEAVVINEFKSPKNKANSNLLTDIRMRRQWKKNFAKLCLSDDETYFLLKQLQKCNYFRRALNTSDEKIQQLSCLVTQFDALDVENLFTQHVKLKGIPAATLQHGHFHASESSDNGDFVIGVPFEGFASDLFLVWGEYAKQEALANSISPKAIECVGSLKITRHNDRNTSHESKSQIFAVALNGGSQSIDNKLIMQCAELVAQKYSLEYIVRPHPTDLHVYDEAVYACMKRLSPSSERIEDIANSCTFCICGNTTLFSEWIASSDNPVFRLTPSAGFDIYSRLPSLSFSNEGELLNLVASLMKDRNKFVNQIEHCRDFLFARGEVSNNYRAAIEKLIKLSRS